MDLTIQIEIFNNVKYRQAICLRYFTSLTMLGCEGKTTTRSAIKENLILNCRKFSVSVIALIN